MPQLTQLADSKFQLSITLFENAYFLTFSLKLFLNSLWSCPLLSTSSVCCYYHGFSFFLYFDNRFTAFSLPGQLTPRSESANSTLANSLPGTFAPGAKWPGNLLLRKYIATYTRRESSRERNGHGAKGPGSERTRERIGPGPICRFAPRSEMAREWKGSVPNNCISRSSIARRTLFIIPPYINCMCLSLQKKPNVHTKLLLIASLQIASMRHMADLSHIVFNGCVPRIS